MENFIKFANTLPKHLNAETQQNKLTELAELKAKYEETKTKESESAYYTLRNELIERNLRLCSDFAIKHHDSYGSFVEVSDIFGECVCAMEKALDDFDINRGLSFTTVCYKYMQTHMLNLMKKRDKDASSRTVEATPNEDNEKDDNDILQFLFDENESHIAEDLAREDVLKDIYRFLNNIENDTLRKMFLLSTGLGATRKYSTVEISKKFNFSQSYVSRKVMKIKQDLLDYLQGRYPELVVGIGGADSNVAQRVKCESVEKRDEYIFNSYYGLNGHARKGSVRLSRELGIACHKVEAIIKKLEKTMGKDIAIKNDKIAARGKKYNDELSTAVIEDYFGLNGKTMLSANEILVKHKLTKLNSIRLITSKYLKENCSAEQRELLLEKRKNLKKTMDKSVYIYFSIHGLNGHEKKSQTRLAQELNMPRQTIQYRANSYEKYLNNLSEEERIKILTANSRRVDM